MKNVTFVESIPVQNTLGECILAQPGTAFIWWTDIQNCQLYRYNWKTKEIMQWTTFERLSSFGFVKLERGAPETPLQLIAAFESGFALYKPETGQVEWLAQPETHLPCNRFNDGRVDRQGRFWAGCMVEGTAMDSNKDFLASLYRLDQGVSSKMADGINISNSICWSLDSKIMYFADSAKQSIYAYDFDEMSGNISNRRIFVRTCDGASPDGSVVDAEGYLWNAEWKGHRIVRYAPNGDINLVLPLPVSQPTCLTFGGADMSVLFVTSAREGLSVEEFERQPMAGNVLIYKTDFCGVSEQQYVV
ncbi:MAG: gluconolaconase [Alphaproteobacteria bacterium]|nr:MAG: gluconolaconase [Alphaproteobacteria bacterium]